MQCPNDQTTLAMTERQGVEIDYCPTCRGVWLDRGELDKLISASESQQPSHAQQQYQQPQRQYNESRQQEPKYHDRYDNNRSYDHKKKRKESFLGDLFDF